MTLTHIRDQVQLENKNSVLSSLFYILKLSGKMNVLTEF